MSYWYIPGFLGILFIAQYWKSFPFSYHIRVTLLTIYEILFGKPLNSPSDVVVSSAKVYLGELDWNMHMNNSNYALEADIFRYKWFANFLTHSPRWVNILMNTKIASGGVATWFLKELRLGQKYVMETSAVGCDEKWIYLRTRFLIPASKSGKPETVSAVMFIRIVFKEKSGKTIPPKDVLEMVGYDPSSLPNVHDKGFMNKSEASSPTSSISAYNIKKMLESYVNLGQYLPKNSRFPIDSPSKKEK